MYHRIRINTGTTTIGNTIRGEMRFKSWFEAVITRDTAKTLVLNAIGIETDSEEQGELLGSLIGQYKNLEDKLTAFSEIRPYATEIAGYIHGNPKRTLQDLINFVAKLDDQGEEQLKRRQKSIGIGGLPKAMPEPIV